MGEALAQRERRPVRTALVLVEPVGDGRRQHLADARVEVGGCPFGDADSDWARDELVPRLSEVLQQVAAAEGAQFLDLQDALQGREVCAAGAVVSDGSPEDTTDEWVRFLRPASFQGRVQEAVHPNAFGQRALGRCLELLWGTPDDVACRPTAGEGVAGMRLEPLG